MTALEPGVLLVSTAANGCTDAVEAMLPRDTVLSIHRPSEADQPDSLAHLPASAYCTILLVERGLRASEQLRATADSAIRAGRPCLFLYRSGSFAGQIALPIGCVKASYKTRRDAASQAADFVSRVRARSLKVFAIDIASPSWNKVVSSAIERVGAERIVPIYVTPEDYATAARKSHITIVMPGCRQWALADQLARAACEASQKAGGRWLYIRSSLALTIPDYVAARPPGCELAVCARREDVAEAVNKFVDDAMTT